MILTRPPTAPEVARDLAVLVSYLHGPSAAVDTQAAVQAAIGSACRVYHSPRTASQPAFILADAGDWSFAIIEGCSSLTQGVLALDGYRGGLTDSVSAPRNAYFDQVKDAVIDAARTQGMLQAVNVVCAGHSMGGAVAELLAGQLRDVSRTSNVAYCSFGSPKPSSWPNLAGVNRCVAARWFNIDDPVPLIMPTSADNLAMLVTFGVRENQRFSNFAQPFGGLQLGAAGQITAATYPETASVDTISNIAAWLYSLDTTAGVAHSLQTYLARLGGAVTALGDNADHPLHANHTDDSGGQSSRELTDAQRTALQALKEQERVQHQGVLNIPLSLKYQAVKIGKIWQVVWSDSPVAVASRKRTAHSLAAKLNEFSQAVLKQGLVDAKMLSESVSAYLAAASDPASAVTPKLQQSLKTE